MDSNLKFELLLNTSRLQEIYELRVDAYENSEQSAHVNKVIYPNGWSDSLDEKEETFHWVVTNNNKIIRTAFARGHNHDSNLFKTSKLFTSKNKNTRRLGYMSMDKYHKNNTIPHKKKKSNKLWFSDNFCTFSKYGLKY